MKHNRKKRMTGSTSALEKMNEGNNAIVAALTNLGSQVGSLSSDVKHSVDATKDVQAALVRVIENQAEQKTQLSQFGWNYQQMKADFDESKKIVLENKSSIDAVKIRTDKLELILLGTPEFPGLHTQFQLILSKVTKSDSFLFGDDSDKENDGFSADIKAMAADRQKRITLFSAVGALWTFGVGGGFIAILWLIKFFLFNDPSPPDYEHGG